MAKLESHWSRLCCDPLAFNAVLLGVIRVEKTMQMNNEIAHHGVVDSSLSSTPPGGKRSFVVRVYADYIECFEVIKVMTIQGFQLAPEHEVEALCVWLCWHFILGHRFF